MKRARIGSCGPKLAKHGPKWLQIGVTWEKWGPIEGRPVTTERREGKGAGPADPASVAPLRSAGEATKQLAILFRDRFVRKSVWRGLAGRFPCPTEGACYRDGEERIAVRLRHGMRMPQLQIAIYVPVSAVFPDVVADFATLRSLLQGLSRTDTLIWCARLNLALSDRNMAMIDRQACCLERFLSQHEIDRVTAFIDEGQATRKQLIIFSRGQMLELVRWVALYCRDLPGDVGDGNTFVDPEVRRRFAQAALICSDIVDAAIYPTGSVDETADSLLRGRTPGVARKATEPTATTDLYTCLGRGWALFGDYLPRYSPSFNEEFRCSTGLSIEQYFACLSMVAADSRRPALHAGFRYRTVMRRTPYKDVFGRYMTLQSQTPGEMRRAFRRGFPKHLPSLEQAPVLNKRPLLDRPILRTRRGLAIILDSLCFGESILAGPLFHVLAKHPARKQDLFSAFGKAFEDYVNDILTRMFPTSPVLTKRLSTNEEVFEHGGCRLEIDACINDGKKIVLVETKSVWMQEKTLLTEDHEQHKEYLRSKYVDDRGVGQLARAISALSDPRQSEANNKFTDARLIYPVMVVRDQFVPSSFLGGFIQSEFESCLKPDAVIPSTRMRKAHLTVTPPIVMHVETLEGLEHCIEHFGFVDLLDDYSRECSHGMTSLGNFLATSPKYEPHFDPRKSVAAKAVEAVRAAAHEVFPDADLSNL